MKLPNQPINDRFCVVGITDYIKGGYLMRRAWKLYDKCYCEISAIGGPFLMWAPELRESRNGADLQSDLDVIEEALDEVEINLEAVFLLGGRGGWCLSEY